jgi:hypothetical protein
MGHDPDCGHDPFLFSGHDRFFGHDRKIKMVHDPNKKLGHDLDPVVIPIETFDGANKKAYERT